MNVNRIADGYLDAIEFTECHSDNPELKGADFSQSVIDHATNAAQNLVNAFGHTLLDGTAASAEQIGHDLWLTRNGHGAGFWDREDIYGPITSEHLTLYSQSIGEVWAYLGDDQLIYIQ